MNGPGDARYRLDIARGDLVGRRYKEALSAYEEVHDNLDLTAGESVELSYATAYLFDRMGDVDASRQRLKDARPAQAPHWLDSMLQPVQLMDSGWAALEGKNWNEALRLFQEAESGAKAVGEAPSEGTMVGFLQALRKSDRVSEAADLLPSDEQMRDKKQYHLLEEAGWIALRSSEPRTAQDRFEAVRENWPDSGLATTGLAAALLDRERYHAAADLLDAYDGPPVAGIHVERGRLFMQKPQPEYMRAEAEFKLALNIAPDSDEARNNLEGVQRRRNQPSETLRPSEIGSKVAAEVDSGNEALYRQDYATALKRFQHVIDHQDSKNKWAQHGKFNALRCLGQVKKAEELLLSISDPESRTWKIARGALRFEQCQYAEAQRIFETILSEDEENGHDVAAAIWLARTYRRLHKLTKADEVLSRVRSEGDEPPELTVAVGWLRYDQHRYADAQRAFEKAYGPRFSPEAVAAKCATHRALREFDQVEEFLATVTPPLGDQDLPMTFRLHKERGWLAYERRQYDKSASAFEQALQCVSDDADSMLWLASALRHQHDFVRATEVIEQAQSMIKERLGIESSALIDEAAWLAYDQGELDRASKLFEAAWTKDPTDTVAICGASAVLRRQATRPSGPLLIKAGLQIEEAARRYPESVLLRCELGLIYGAQGEFEKARTTMVEVLTSDPPNEIALATMVRVHLGMCLREQESDRAQKDLREWVARAEDVRPDNGEVRSALSEAYEYLGSPHDESRRDPVLLGKALALVTGLISDFGETPQALASQVRLLRKCKRERDSEELLQGALQQFESSAELATEQAELEYRHKHYSQAADWLDKAVDRNPWQPNAWAKICYLLGLTNQWEACLDRATKGLAYCDGDGNALQVERGYSLLAMADLAEAESAFDLALRHDSRNDRALSGKVLCLRRTGRFDDAQGLLEDPHLGCMTVARAVALSQLLCDRQDADKACEVLEQLRHRVNTKRAQEQLDISLALVEMSEGQYKQAQERLEGLPRQSLESTPARYYYAWSLVGQCEMEGAQLFSEGDGAERSSRQRAEELRRQAERLCEEVSNDEPCLAGPYACRARIAVQRGQPSVAAKLWKRAVELDPLGGHQGWLAAIYLDMGHHDEATRVLDSALRLNWFDENVHQQRGRLLSETGDDRDGIIELRRARAINPRDPRLVSQLAITLVNSGRYAEALQEVREASRRLSESDQRRLSTTTAWVLLKQAAASNRPRSIAKVIREIHDLSEADAAYQLHYYRGVARILLADASDAFRRTPLLFQARQDFQRCNDEYRARFHCDHAESRRYLDELRPMLLIGKQDNVGVALFFGIVITIAAMLTALFLHKTDGETLQVLIPTLMALGLVALLLPVVSSFKVGAVEAQVREPIDMGVTNELDIGPLSPLAAKNPIWEDYLRYDPERQDLDRLSFLDPAESVKESAMRSHGPRRDTMVLCDVVNRTDAFTGEPEARE